VTLLLFDVLDKVFGFLSNVASGVKSGDLAECLLLVCDVVHGCVDSRWTEGQEPGPVRYHGVLCESESMFPAPGWWTLWVGRGVASRGNLLYYEQPLMGNREWPDAPGGVLSASVEARTVDGMCA